MYVPCRHAGQSRPPRLPKGDVNDTWKHDMFESANSLGARLGGKATVPKINVSGAERALREANGEKGIAIKGASSRGNVVEVSGLADGTTSEDVEVCAGVLRRRVQELMMRVPRPSSSDAVPS